MSLFLLALLLAVQTATTPTSPAPLRLAFVVGKTSQPDMQPSFERFANDVATQFANRFSVVTVPVPSSGRPQQVNPALCNTLGIVGFLVPTRHWQTGATSVIATVRLVVYNCAGDRFFDDSGDFMEPRIHTTVKQEQIESTASGATGVVLAKFAQFESSHQIEWTRFLATGPLRDVSPSPSP
jgi:hypothetical protein